MGDSPIVYWGRLLIYKATAIKVYPQEYLDELYKIADRISKKSYVSYYSREDVYQHLVMEGLRYFPKHSFAVGEYAPFISSVLYSKLKNLHRNLVRRNEPPCPKCLNDDFCEIGGCEAHNRWATRNGKKSDLSRPAPCGVYVEPLSTISVEDEVLYKELSESLLDLIPQRLRVAYHKMLGGLPVCPDEAEQVRALVRTHLNG